MEAESSWFERAWVDNRTKSFVAFFGASAAGLAIDLIGFQLLVFAQLQPWLANVLSSFTSITVVYLLATRHAFGASTRATTYVLFVGWYSLSILTFSGLIQWATTATDLHPFIWKLLSVPVSFALNYLFSTVLFRKR